MRCLSGKAQAIPKAPAFSSHGHYRYKYLSPHYGNIIYSPSHTFRYAIPAVIVRIGFSLIYDIRFAPCKACSLMQRQMKPQSTSIVGKSVVGTIMVGICGLYRVYPPRQAMRHDTDGAYWRVVSKRHYESIRAVSRVCFRQSRIRQPQTSASMLTVPSAWPASPSGILDLRYSQ